MKVGSLLPYCAGCNSHGRGCPDARSSTVPCRSGSARSRNGAACPRCHPVHAGNPAEAMAPLGAAWSGQWWPLPAACRTCGIWKANRFCHQRPCSWLPGVVEDVKSHPVFFSAGFCRWSRRKRRENCESWTRFWLSLEARKWSKGKLGVLDQSVWLTVTTQRVQHLLDTEK